MAAKRWTVAQSICEAIGANLVIIDTEREQKALAQYLNQFERQYYSHPILSVWPSTSFCLFLSLFLVLCLICFITAYFNDFWHATS